MLRVKEILKERNITAKELAGKIGITEGALSQSLKKDANPSMQTLKRIAEGLGISMSELFAKPTEGIITCPHCGKEITLKAKCSHE